MPDNKSGYGKKKNSKKNNPAAEDKKKPARNRQQPETANKKNNKNSNQKKRKKSSNAAPVKTSSKKNPKKGTVKIAFLGGINEIGKNITLYEYNNEIIIVDCGMSFPDADMPGIDYVLPDISYVERNADKIKAIFITHGHEDHIGGLPYLLKSVNVPVYSTGLTIGLIKGKLKEHRMLSRCSLNTIKPGDIINTGAFAVEAIHVNHSIPDSVAFAVKCDAGTIVHTGDFKIDNTPIDGGVMNLPRFAELGNEGVLCYLADSTNAELAGYTPSEKNVGETLDSLFRKAEGKRIIVASFASNIHRIQQIIMSAVKMKRHIFLSGRSLENVVSVSRELGYLNIPDGALQPIDNLKNYRDEDTVIITTGSQGEPMSALSRMAASDHRKVSVGYNDFIIISATPIPGNEKTVANTINELMKLGAEVVYEKNLGIHVSGHAAQEEQKLLLNLVRPKYFIPVHGEQKHLRKHAALAASIGIPEQNIMIPELGAVIEVSENFISYVGSVPAGRVYIDNSGVSDVGNSVLNDRKKLSNDGIVIVTAVTDSYSGDLILPLDVQTKGFVFMENANEFTVFIYEACERIFEDFVNSPKADYQRLKIKLKDAVSKVIFDKTRRSPIIIVTVLAV